MSLLCFPFPDPPTVLLHPMSTSVPMNSVIRLYCTYRNYTAVEFQLIKDGEVFDSANYIRKASRQSSPAQEFMIHGTEPDWQGYFHCMVKDALNHTVNSTKTLVRFTGKNVWLGPFCIGNSIYL